MALPADTQSVMPIVRSAARNEPTGYLREVTRAEDALCADPCAAAWQTLVALRGLESVNEVLAARRRLEYEAGQPLAPVLSEVLLDRWRAGDWTVTPQDLGIGPVGERPVG